MNLLVILASEGGEAAAENGFLLAHDVKEVAVSAAASIILFALLWWKGGPALKQMWNGRIERISSEISDAEAARAEAGHALADVQNRVQNLDQERTRLLAEARQTAEAVRQQLEERGAQEAADLRARAAADAESTKAQAAADLQAEVASLAVGAAEAVVRNNLDEATQRELIDRYIEQVGAR